MGTDPTQVEPRTHAHAGRRLDLFPYGLLLPSMAVLAVLLLYPIGRAVLTSLGRHVLFCPQGNRAFIGLANYAYLLTDFRTWHSLYLAALYSVVVVSQPMGSPMIPATRSRWLTTPNW